MAKLTPKQEMFCREYLVDLNGAAAAVRAGYSEKTANRIASENLSKPDIMERVAELKRERTKRVEITADYVLSNLQEVVERCMQREPVMCRTGQVIDEDGNHLWEFDSKGALRGLELMGKHIGLFSDKVQLSGNDGGPIQEELTIRLVRPNHADR